MRVIILAMESKPLKIALLALALCLASCSEGSAIGSDGSSGRSSTSIQKPTEKQLKNTKMIAEVAIAQSKAVEQEMGDGFYDFFCTRNSSGLSGRHPHYDLSKVARVLRENEESELADSLSSVDFPCVFPDQYEKSEETVTVYRKGSQEDPHIVPKNSVIVELDTTFTELQMWYCERALDKFDAFIGGLCNMNFISVKPYDIPEVNFREGDSACVYGDFDFLDIPRIEVTHNPTIEAKIADPLGIFRGSRSSSTKIGAYSAYDYSIGYSFDGGIIEFKDEVLDPYEVENFDPSAEDEGLLEAVYHASTQVQVFVHEMCHFLGLDDLYVKEGYNDGDYHPNNGNSIMKGVSTTPFYTSDKPDDNWLFARDKKNLEYVYGGAYESTLKRVEAEVRAKYA